MPLQLSLTRPVLKSVLVISRRAKLTEVAAALQVWSNTFSKSFDSLPDKVQISVRDAIDEMGRRLESYSLSRLQGRKEFRLRVGDYRVIYEVDFPGQRILLLFVGHRRGIYRRT